MRSGKLNKHILEVNPESSQYYGIMVATPCSMPNTTDGKFAEYEKPTLLSNEIEWQLTTMISCNEGPRKRSINELLFLMLRAGK